MLITGKSAMRILTLGLILTAFAASGLAQQKDLPAKLPVPPLLEEHTRWFNPPTIYHLRKDHFPLKDYPEGLDYEVYSAVGYDLANTIVILGPKRDATGNREIVIVDTLGNPGITQKVIAEFRKQGIFPAGTDPNHPPKLPIRAIIFTHNHIDHTAGVEGYLREADRPPCQPENPNKPGADNYFNADAEAADCVPVIGQAQINDGVGTTALVTGTIIDARSSYMYGAFIPRNHVNDGIGPQEYTSPPNQPGYRMPSRTFTNQLLVTAAGVQMKLVYVPSETNDELSAFVPDKMNRTGSPRPTSESNSSLWGGPGLLLSAEVIQGPAFPNLYSLRGTSYRNPATWFRSVDELRRFDSWCMVPSHGPPLCEASNIQRLLRNFRDAIQFTHDQTLRFLNKGYTMEELAPLIESMYMSKGGEENYIMSDLTKVQPIQNKDLAPGAECPPTDQSCVDPRDYLRPFYGSVVQAVRELYFGSVGWFQADPVGLRPTPPKELAQRFVNLMCASDSKAADGHTVCGPEAVNKAAQDALARGEDQYAAELATLVIRSMADPSDPSREPASGPFVKAREIKATAFEKLATNPDYSNNPNWRNWYITAAHELQGRRLPSDIKGGLVSPDTIAALPAGAWVNSLTMRLKAELTAKDDLRKSLGFWFPAAGDQGFGALGYELRIRHGIAEFVQNLSEEEVSHADLAISMDKPTLNQLIVAESKGRAEFAEALAKAIAEGRIKSLNGSLQDFENAFETYFEPKPTGLPPLTVR